MLDTCSTLETNSFKNQKLSKENPIGKVAATMISKQPECVVDIGYPPSDYIGYHSAVDAICARHKDVMPQSVVMDNEPEVTSESMLTESLSFKMSPSSSSGLLKTIPKIIMMGLVLPIIYGLFCGPLFYVSANPDEHVKSLSVLVASYDEGPLVGPQFLTYMKKLGKDGPQGQTSWVMNNGAKPTTMPGFTFVEQGTMSADELRQKVKDSEVWGAVFVNAGASEALSTALESPEGAAAYEPLKAISFVWDESKYEGLVIQITCETLSSPILAHL